jgi:iron complex outermembrane recepter protein
MRPFFMTLVLAALTLSLPAQNQPTQLAPVIVTAEANKNQSLTVPSAETAAQQLNRVAGGTDLIKAEDYKQGRASTLKDALQFSPGLIVQPRFGSDEARLSIRGSGIQRTFHGRGLVLLQDGVPLNLADGGFDMQGIEALATNYIEVFRGANALQYGSSTLGGAINYVSPTGYDAARIQARGEFGSFGYWKGQLSSGLVAGPYDYYATITQSYQDGFRDHSEQNTQRVLANVGVQLDKDLETRFYGTFINTESELPGNLTKEEMEANPEQANAANINRDQKRDFKLSRIANKTSYQWDAQTFASSAYLSNKDLYHPIFNVIDQVSNDFGLDVKYTSEKDLLARQNRFILGTRQQLGITEADQFGYAAATGQARGTQNLDSTQTASSSTLYAENTHYVYEQWGLVTGLQLDWSTRDNETRLNTLTTTRSAYESYYAANPKIGLIYEPNPDIVVFTNFSRGYEPPSFSELFDSRPGSGLPTTAAQESYTYEIGSRGKTGKVDWDATIYHAWVYKELISVANAAQTNTATINAKNTLHTGFELGLGYQIWSGLAEEKDSLKLQQNYTWSRFRFDNDPAFGHNQIAGLPEHFYIAELRYEHPNGFYTGPNVEATFSGTPIDHANTAYANAYGLIGWKAGYKTSFDLSIFVDARNLTDETYAATTSVVDNARLRGTAQFNPGDGRAFYGGVEYKF